MKEHKHAALFRAIADSDDLSQWEAKLVVWPYSYKWLDIAADRLSSIFKNPNEWEVRRKTKTIRIGDMDVPEPMREAPPVGAKCFFVSTLHMSGPLIVHGHDVNLERDYLKTGMLHTTEEAARLHREALIRVSGGAT